MKLADILDLENSRLANVYEKMPVAIVRGRGAHVWDSENREYLDFMGGYGVALIGHSHPELVRALSEQAEKIITCHGSLFNDARANFLHELFKILPSRMGRVFIGNSGAEAVECALKLAQKFTGKRKIIAMKGSFHGKTRGALSVTWGKKYREAFESVLAEVSFASYGDAVSVSKVVDSDVGAVIVEPVQGEAGVRIPPPDFLRELREICDTRGMLLIADEIQCGLGRTGSMWACDHFRISPDIMCIAKGIAGGLPMGVTAAREDIMVRFGKGEHTSTFGGNSLSCAAASATLRIITREQLPERAREIGDRLVSGLRRLAERHSTIREARGIGLMQALEFRFPIKELLGKLLDNGMLSLYSGLNTLRFLPPLVLTEGDVDLALSKMDTSISQQSKQ